VRFFFLPLAIAYGIITKLRNFFYNHGLLKISKVSIPIISVGNITTGGTGKTPMTICLAEEAKLRGFRPGIVSRGYGRDSNGVQIVYDGNEFQGTIEDSGDEPFLMASKLKNVPVIVSENRIDGAEKLIQDYDVDVILLDDGFQHRSIFRNINILLLNALEKDNAYHLLPMGSLRESLPNLYRADYIFLTKGSKQNLSSKVRENVDAFIETNLLFKLKKYISGKLVDSEIPKFPLVAFCGIAHPKLFFNSVESYGIKLSGSLGFSDHIIYDNKIISQIHKSILNNDNALITTEKDLVKLSNSFLTKFDVYVLTMNFDIPPSVLDKIFNSLK